MNKSLRVHMLVEGRLKPKERQQLTQIIMKKKNSNITIDGNKITFKKQGDNLLVIFDEKNDELLMSVVNIIDILGFEFDKNKKGLLINY